MSDFDQPMIFLQQNSSRHIGSLVEQEARRVLAEANLRPNPALVAEGWERRFIADARQAKEAMELYSQLGFEVLAEPVQASEMDQDCEDCQVMVLLQFKTIYTRKKKTGESTRFPVSGPRSTGQRSDKNVLKSV